MLRNYHNFILLIVSVLLVTSCEVPIDIEGDSKIIVQSYFTGEQDLIVYVSESTPRNSEDITKVVENASVTLFLEENIQSAIQTLQFVDNANPPYYTTQNFKPEVGKVYVLNVDVPGFKPVTASNSIPEPVDIVDIAYNNSVTPNGNLSDVQFEVVVTIEDPQTVENYYHILFTQQMYSLESNAEGEIDTIILDSGNDLQLNSIGKFIEVDQYFNHPSFFLNDSGFNGEIVEISFGGSYSYDPTIHERGEFTVELRTVSKAYYEHFQNLLSEPEDPLSGIGGVGSSNVTNGAGVFAGYSSNKGFKNPN